MTCACDFSPSRQEKSHEIGNTLAMFGFSGFRRLIENQRVRSRMPAGRKGVGSFPKAAPPMRPAPYPPNFDDATLLARSPCVKGRAGGPSILGGCAIRANDGAGRVAGLVRGQGR